MFSVYYTIGSCINNLWRNLVMISTYVESSLCGAHCMFTVVARHRLIVWYGHHTQSSCRLCLGPELTFWLCFITYSYTNHCVLPSIHASSICYTLLTPRYLMEHQHSLYHHCCWHKINKYSYSMIPCTRDILHLILHSRSISSPPTILAWFTNSCVFP